jgi:hypothetical protein
MMEKGLKYVWNGKTKDLTEIFAWTNKTVSRFLEPIASSIISHVSEEGRISSKFFREAYLQQFPKKEREFAEAFSKTQMFQLQVEQDCRRRSDGLLSQN